MSSHDDARRAEGCFWDETLGRQGRSACGRWLVSASGSFLESQFWLHPPPGRRT